jgi:hypothetical protein
VSLLEGAKKRQSIHPGPNDVRDHEIELPSPRQSQRLLARLSFGHPNACFLLQEYFQQQARGNLVVNDQQDWLSAARSSKTATPHRLWRSAESAVGSGLHVLVGGVAALIAYLRRR